MTTQCGIPWQKIRCQSRTARTWTACICFPQLCLALHNQQLPPTLWQQTSFAKATINDLIWQKVNATNLMYRVLQGSED